MFPFVVLLWATDPRGVPIALVAILLIFTTMIEYKKTNVLLEKLSINNKIN